MTEPNDAASVRRAQEDALAREILTYARQTLMAELRFLDTALNRPRWFLLPAQGMATDGNALGYDPRFLLNAYRTEQNRVARVYLHTVMHCVFRHVFQAAVMDRTLWDLACDMAVEYVIHGLNMQAVRCTCDDRQWEELELLHRELEQMTADRIYRYYRDHPLSDERRDLLKDLFHADDHFPWYTPQPLRADESRAGGNQGGRYRVENENGKKTEGGSGENGKQLQEQPGSPDSDPQEEWEQIARRMKTDLETAARKKGGRSGSMLQALRTVHREVFDYTTFLQKFSVLGEQLKLDPNEFDYIFYTYGLQRYGNLPLIEPLEYSEARHVKEFIIAIDTSGSVKGPLVQAFVQKTYNILKSTESFASRVNVHILQCDNQIQEHVKITTLSEFDNYLHSMKLKGFGGTDFRPVFEYVDELIRQKEFRNLRGLIYFTDGRGEYPRKKPSYETAFVFLEHADNLKKVPSWSIQLTLPEEEIISS